MEAHATLRRGFTTTTSGPQGIKGQSGPDPSSAAMQIQIAAGYGNLTSDLSFYFIFIQGPGWASLRCNWPTSNPAIPGAIWNNNGVLNVSSG